MRTLKVTEPFSKYYFHRNCCSDSEKKVANFLFRQKHPPNFFLFFPRKFDGFGFVFKSHLRQNVPMTKVWLAMRIKNSSEVENKRKDESAVEPPARFTSSHANRLPPSLMTRAKNKWECVNFINYLVARLVLVSARNMIPIKIVNKFFELSRAHTVFI